MLPFFLVPLVEGDFLTFIPLMEGFTFLCPPLEGVGGGYNNHLRHFVTPPPAEDKSVTFSYVFSCHSKK